MDTCGCGYGHLNALRIEALCIWISERPEVVGFYFSAVFFPHEMLTLTDHKTGTYSSFISSKCLDVTEWFCLICRGGLSQISCMSLSEI